MKPYSSSLLAANLARLLLLLLLVLQRSREQIHLLRFDVFELVSILFTSDEALRLLFLASLSVLLDLEGSLEHDVFDVRDAELLRLDCLDQGGLMKPEFLLDIIEIEVYL